MFNSEITSLETYLSQIARELRDLPAQARTDEMREIEGHLRALVLASQQLEKISHADATALALKQFGAPRGIGSKLRKAWKRKQPEAWWRAILAPIILATSYFFGGSALMQLFFAFAPNFYGIYYVLIAIICFVTFTGSYIAGLISPKRSLFGIAALLLSLTLNGLFTEDFLNFQWLISHIIICMSATMGAYFGARFSRKRAIARTL